MRCLPEWLASRHSRIPSPARVRARLVQPERELRWRAERKAFSLRLRVRRQRELLRAAGLLPKESPSASEPEAQRRPGRPPLPPIDDAIAVRIAKHRAHNPPMGLRAIAEKEGITEHAVRQFVDYHGL